jgi:putative spermidine/putrescine transport system ATP-binding protein
MKDIKDAYVEFKDLTKTYNGESLIVDKLNLDIRSGEFLTLLGPSGSGKTTCLMMLAGFEAPTSGEIRIAGQVVNKTPPHKRNIGVVFQNYALFPHMTVEENLKFPLQARHTKKNEMKTMVSEALAMVRLEHFANRYPQQLSGGQQQRIALARALIFKPNLVLMDEPLGALDKQLREHMQLEIKHIHQQLGVTVVFVTHDQSEALTMSDRIAVFDHGQIQQIGTATQVYEEPENAFVAGFIGENNSMRGVVGSTNGLTCGVILESGASIKAKSHKKKNTGDKVTISIRPERARVVPSFEISNNTLKGKIREIVYKGDHVQIRIVLNCGENFEVKTAVSSIEKHVNVNEDVCIVLDEAHVHVLES